MQTDNHDGSDAQPAADVDEGVDIEIEHAVAQATGAVFEGEPGRAGEL